MEGYQVDLPDEIAKLMAELFSSVYMTQYFLCWKAKDDLVSSCQIPQVKSTKSEPANLNSEVKKDKILKIRKDKKVIKKAKEITSKKQDKNANNKTFKEETKSAFYLAVDFFTSDELKTSYFGDNNGKTRSQTRKTFDSLKTEQFKSQLFGKLNLDKTNFDLIWPKIRANLNKLLANRFKNE